MARLPGLQSEGPAGDRHSLPVHAELSALRAVCEGIDTRAAVERYAPHLLLDGSTARAVNPALAAKLRRASTHWMRHTHATHALENGVPLTSVRDNLRHASLATTSTYLHTDEDERARALGKAFGASS